MALFLVDAVLSLVDDVLIAGFQLHILSLIRGLVAMAAIAMAIGLYALIGFAPIAPKRSLLCIPAFYLASALILFPLAIYWYGEIQLFAVGLSICQMVLGVGILYSFRRGSKPTWPLVPEDRVEVRRFHWRGPFAFVLANVFVLLPLVVVYVFLCTARAVAHFSEGFMALHPSGFTVQVRKYVRDDGKVIELFPMAHVANAAFYQKVSQTFPTNSLILMEGVSDNDNLLTNKISYKRMARSLGLAEQKETFTPPSNEVVHADVDVSQFSSETIHFLNVAMTFHSEGVNAGSFMKFAQFTPAPGFEKRLFDDILRKRNEHLLAEIRSHLPESNSIMVPWGVAHMPGIAREIQKSGFHLAERHDYTVISFGGRGAAKPR
ncbi:MAG TPA: hypothetical protein VN761_10250 [Candidatus Polarisedimenticolia bacterium]|nr:hypothetical protein [Candidatus Polarisedimenticolia bacterium]